MTRGLLQLALAGSLALGCASHTVFAPNQPAEAATVSERLQQLENKTNYYNKKNRKVAKQYRRQPGATTAPQACSEFLQMSFNPDVQTGGTAHAWISATIAYNGDPANIDMNWAPVGFGFPCNRAKVLPAGSGSFTLKQYCSFDVDTGDIFRVTFNTGRGCVDDIVQSINATMKFTVIQVVEPP